MSKLATLLMLPTPPLGGEVARDLDVRSPRTERPSLRVRTTLGYCPVMVTKPVILVRDWRSTEAALQAAREDRRRRS